jgi:predicted amino acid racemase
VPYPRLTTDLGKLRHNLDVLLGICHEHGIGMAAVTKVVCADPRIVALLEDSPVEMLADARIRNLQSMQTTKPRMLMRLSMPSEVEAVVACAEISLQSEIHTLRCLAGAAERQGVRHKVVLMIDMGDLREGIFFQDRERIHQAVEEILSAPSLELHGLGVNLTCYGAILPDQENLGGLVALAEELRKRYGIALPMVSGGNSSTIGMVREGRAPAGITNLRLGEALMLGNDTAACCLMEGLHGDAFTLSAELIELQRKPIGTSGANAFGEKVTFEDHGPQLRGILAVGRQDVVAEGLTPHDTRVRLLGASSDHLLVDLSEAPEYRVGDPLHFNPDYGALLRASTSPYVHKDYIG